MLRCVLVDLLPSSAFGSRDLARPACGWRVGGGLLSRSTWVALVCLVAVGGGCASWSAAYARSRDGTYVHRERGDRIGSPRPVGGIDWERKRVEGADLSFRLRADEGGAPSQGAATLTMLSECGKHAPVAQLKARNLRLGLGRSRSRYSAPTAHLGHTGWAQAFDAKVDEATVYVEAVTLVVDRCTFDMILATPVESPELVGAFQDWWSGFVPGPGSLSPSRELRGAGSEA